MNVNYVSPRLRPRAANAALSSSVRGRTPTGERLLQPFTFCNILQIDASLAEMGVDYRYTGQCHRSLSHQAPDAGSGNGGDTSADGSVSGCLARKATGSSLNFCAIHLPPPPRQMRAPLCQDAASIPSVPIVQKTTAVPRRGRMWRPVGRDGKVSE